MSDTGPGRALRRAVAVLSYSAAALAAGCGNPPAERADRGDRGGDIAGARGTTAASMPQFGVVWARDDTVCLRTSEGARATAARILIVVPDRQEAMYAGIEEELAACPGEPAGPDRQYFRLSAPGYEAGDLGIAVLADSPPVQPGGRTDLDRDGIPEHYRICASSEGVHLTVWAGEPPGGRRIWHHYHYLGYDMEPNCGDGETGND